MYVFLLFASSGKFSFFYVPLLYSLSLVYFTDVIIDQQRYSDLFITAKLTSASARRTASTMYTSVSYFYTQIILHRRLLRPEQSPTAFHLHALQNIVEIMHKQYESEPRNLRRMMWPAFAALIETQDEEQRKWLLERIQELRDFSCEFYWGSKVAEEVLARQQMSSEFVDVGELIRECIMLGGLAY